MGSTSELPAGHCIKSPGESQSQEQSDTDLMAKTHVAVGRDPLLVGILRGVV